MEVEVPDELCNTKQITPPTGSSYCSLEMLEAQGELG